MENFWTAKEFLSAIVGAIVGGGIGLLGQWLTIKQASRIKRSEASERRGALGHSLIFKLIKTHSQLHNLHKFMQESLINKKAIGEHGEYWQFILPIANLPDKILFDADEMGMLLGLGNHDVFNNVLGIDVLHNDLIEIFSTYRNLRCELSKELPHSNFEGQIGSFGITPERYASLRPKMIELNSLAAQMLERCNKDVVDAWEALKGTNEVLKSHKITRYTVGQKEN